MKAFYRLVLGIALVAVAISALAGAWWDMAFCLLLAALIYSIEREL